MREGNKLEGLPDAAERKRISEHAEKTLQAAWALMERLDQLELAKELAAQKMKALPVHSPPGSPMC
jgi:hypothetical protein